MEPNVTREVREESLQGIKYTEIKTIKGHQYVYQRWLEEVYQVEVITTRTLVQKVRRSKYIGVT